MKKQVYLVPNVYDKSSWKHAIVDDVIAYLIQNYEVLPKNLRIYQNSIASNCDVTPDANPKNIKKFLKLEGTFYIVVSPAELATLTIAAIIAAVVSVTSSVYMLVTMPKQQKQLQQSPNNELNARQNTARYKGRIPDIFGTVLSYPDLISQTYPYYNDDGVEVERSLLAIGKGHYDIKEVHDGSTRVADIPGTSISIYDPNSSIVGTPIYQVGRNFHDMPYEVVMSEAITGQVLDAPDGNLVESNQIYFANGGQIKSKTGINLDFTTIFKANDSISIYGSQKGMPDTKLNGALWLRYGYSPSAEILVFNGNNNNDVLRNAKSITIESTQQGYVFDLSGTYPISFKSVNEEFAIFEILDAEAINPDWQHLNQNSEFWRVTTEFSATFKGGEDSFNVDGIYTVNDVTSDIITLQNVEIISQDWLKIADMPNQNTALHGTTIALDESDTKWVGWHNIFMDDIEYLFLNIHFPQGLYRQNTKGGVSDDYTLIAIEYQNINANGTPVGTIKRISKRYDGETRIPFGKTEKIALNAANGVRFRVSRARANIANNVFAEMRLKDAYVAKNLNHPFYPYTVIQSEAVGSDGLYAIKNRKLNCLVQRKLKRNGTGELVATNDAGQALISAALDPKVGRLSIENIDVDQIAAQMNAIREYFGNDSATDFCATLDDPNLGFQETADTICSAIFSEPTFFANKLRVLFERPQDMATLLFNHRNKVPKSETRSFSVSKRKKYDSVEIEYTDPKDDARITYVVPEDGTGNNPYKISSVGIRNHAQAKTLAWREWNKIVHKRVAAEFTGLDEAKLLTRSDLIMVADNTRTSTQDGEVREVDGLTLHLSQAVVLKNQPNIHVQMPNGTIDSIGITAGEDEYSVVLDRMPLQEFNFENGINPTYQIVHASEKKQLFLVSETTPPEGRTQVVRAYNYDPNYYSKDHHFF